MFRPPMPPPKQKKKPGFVVSPSGCCALHICQDGTLSITGEIPITHGQLFWITGLIAAIFFSHADSSAARADS
jgi:hypothetical protein